MAGIGVQSPQVSLGVGFQSDLLFGTRSERLNPNHAKLCLVLTILNRDRASYFEPATNRAQPNSSFADIESMHQLRVVSPGYIAAKDSYRQHRFGSIETTFIAFDRFRPFSQRLIRRIHNATSFI